MRISSANHIQRDGGGRRDNLPPFCDKEVNIMENEVWKDIPGYEGRYQASSLGQIKSLGRAFERKDWRSGMVTQVPVNGRILVPGRFNTPGHLSVFLRDKLHPNGIGKPVHQLVMLAFVGSVPKGMEVLHKNGDPADNRVTNLRYGSRSENMCDRYRHAQQGLKLTIRDVVEIRGLLRQGVQQRLIALQYSVSDTTISNIKQGRRFQWIR